MQTTNIYNLEGELIVTIPGATLQGAQLQGVDFRGANLREAHLRGADLRRADLQGADLQGADLRRADLRRATLHGANLHGANLQEASLQVASLRGADLREADLLRADLREADLGYARLEHAFLGGANLQWAKLAGAQGLSAVVAARLSILPAGTIRVYKKLRDGSIAELRIDAETPRSNATGRQCRAERAYVCAITDKSGNAVQEGVSRYDALFGYTVGAYVVCDEWEEDRWVECGGGIHFYLTREEAEAHV